IPLTPNDIFNRTREIIDNSNNEIDLVEACTLIIEELDISENEFVKLLNKEFIMMLKHCADSKRKIQRKVCDSSEKLTSE
uniref:late promoter transcription accessory protein n=1 Tax=Flavobacterium sp. TaxID=239 RepID=UPI0026024AEB